ncbi:Structure-specific endonuclease subunit SLX4, variant 3 [Balamuthia mandrillaris]
MDLKKVVLALSGTVIENYDLKEAGLRKLFEQLRDTPFTLIDPLVRSSSLKRPNEHIDAIKEKQLQKKLLQWKEIAGEECIVTSDTLRKAIIRGDVSDCFPMHNKRQKDVLDEMDEEEKETEREKEEEEKEDEAKEKAVAIDTASEKAEKTEEKEENEQENANKEKEREEKEREEDVMIIASSSPPTSPKVNVTKVNTTPKQTEASNDNRRPKKRKAIDLSEKLKQQVQETEAKASRQKENERPAFNNAKKEDSTKGESKALSSPSVQQQREEEREEDTPFRERIMIIQETKLVARPLAPSSSSGSPSTSQQQNFKRFRRKANGQTTTQPRRASTGNTSPSRTVVKCVLDEEREGSPTGKNNKEMERWLQEAQEEAKREEEENHVAEELWNAVKHKTNSSTSGKIMKMRMSASSAASSASSKKSGSLVLPATKRRKSSFV